MVEGNLTTSLDNRVVECARLDSVAMHTYMTVYMYMCIYRQADHESLMHQMPHVQRPAIEVSLCCVQIHVHEFILLS